MFDENVIFYQANSSIMSKGPIELLLVNIELQSKALLQCITWNNNMHLLGQSI